MRVAIIQARTRSTRLPGKVLRTLGAESVISHVYQRVRQAASIDRVVVAMPTGPADDLLSAHVAAFCPDIARGSETDVLDRYVQAARQFGATQVIRITSDCPFIDPDIIDGMISAFNQDGPDYMTNTIVPHLPRGLDAEIMTMAALEEAWSLADKPYEREHVTPYIYLNTDRFVVAGFRIPGDWSDLRWTLDTPEDWALISTMHDLLPLPFEAARLKDFLALYEERPDLRDINAAVAQKKLGG